MNKQLFKKSSTDKISSPEQLNDYIKVSNPSVWIIIAAALILIVSALIWSLAGDLSTSVQLKAYANGGRLSVYVDPDGDVTLEPGMEVAVSGHSDTAITGRIVSVTPTPLSYEEAAATITSEYAVYALALGDWNVCAEIELDGTGSASLTNDAVYDVQVITDSVRPIEFLFGE